MVKRRIPSDSGGSRVCCLLLLFLELLPPHQLLVSVRPRLQRDAASNQSGRTRPPLPPRAPSEQLGPPERMRSDSRTGRLLATISSVHVSRHVTGAGLGQDHHQSLNLLFASLHRSSWASLISPSCPYLRLFLVPTDSHMTTISTHPKQRQRKSLISSLDLLIWVVARSLPDLWRDPLYPTGRPSLTGSHGAVTLSCSAEWCITGTRAHSHGVCFICYNNISAALAYLIYSLDPLQGLQSAHFQADNGGFTIKTSPCFDVLIAHCCYLDLTPGSRGRHLPAVSLSKRLFSQ